MSKSLEILDEIADRVRREGDEGRPASQAEKWVAGAYWAFRKSIEEDLAETRQAVKEKQERDRWPALEVEDLLDQIIEPISRFGHMLACIVNDDNPRSTETIGLSLMAMADGMRFREDEFRKKMDSRPIEVKE